MRRSTLALFASLPLLVPAASPDSKIEVKDLQNHPFAVDFPSGGNLRLHLRSGEFRIVGRNDNRIAVHLNGVMPTTLATSPFASGARTMMGTCASLAVPRTTLK